MACLNKDSWPAQSSNQIGGDLASLRFVTHGDAGSLQRGDELSVRAFMAFGLCVAHVDIGRLKGRKLFWRDVVYVLAHSGLLQRYFD